MASITTAQPRQKSVAYRWPDWILWFLCCLPLIHVILLFGAQTHDEANILYLFRPIGVLAGAAVLLVVGLLERGRRRARCFTVALAWCMSATFSFFRIAGVPLTTPFLQLILVSVYILLVIGVALSFQHRDWGLGSTWRTILGSVTVGCAVKILLGSVLPALKPEWPWTAQADALSLYLAFDIAVMFGVMAVAFRRKFNIINSPLYAFTTLSLVSQVIGSSLYLLVSWAPWASNLYYYVMPIFPITAIMSAFAAYRDYIRPHAQEVHHEPENMPLREWLLWTFVPVASVLVAFLCTTFFRGVSPRAIGVLIVIAIVQETLGLWDYRRVLTTLNERSAELQVALEENRQYMLQAEATATSKERHRLAREVHDTVNFHIPGIHTNLEAATLNWRNKPDRAKEALDAACEAMDELQETMSNSLRNLRADYLAKPMNKLLAELADEIELAGIDAQIITEGEYIEPSDNIKSVLYRTGQEAISNIRKHSKAQNVTIYYNTKTANTIRLVIEDDGKGAETINTKGEGVGVIGMRERVEAVRGSLQIETAPGQGFKTIMEVPIG